MSGAWPDRCPSAPDDAVPGHGPGRHHAAKGERRCVYCGATLAPYACHGCGQWLTARRMWEYDTGEAVSARCNECEP